MSAAETIEVVARALGVWFELRIADAIPNPGLRAWAVARSRTGIRVAYGTGSVPDTWDMTEAEALLWLCLRALPVERETCPTCEGSKIESKIVTREKYASARRVADGLERKGFAATIANTGEPGDHSIAERLTITGSRPCPACEGPDVECSECRGEGSWMSDHGAAACNKCKGTGRMPGEPSGYVEVHRWARAMLGAMPREWRDDEDGRRYLNHRDEPILIPGDPGDRDSLAVFGDQLQAAGDPLGELLILWLTQAPCPSTGLALDARVADLEAVALRMAGVGMRERAAGYAGP